MEINEVYTFLKDEVDISYKADNAPIGASCQKIEISVGVNAPLYVHRDSCRTHVVLRT